jgi:hypothetical protein
MRKLLTIIAFASAASGCLQKETTHTLYLSPDGGVAWTAVESDVHSDEADVGRRLTEEQQYILEAGGGTHGVGRALAALDPRSLRTYVIRADRPFLVVTTAQFDSIEFLAQRLLRRLPAVGTVSLARGSGATCLVLKIDVRATQALDNAGKSPLEALAEDLDRYRFVLTDGRFVSAKGFELEDDGRIARPIETSMEDVMANGGILELSLTWTR